MAKTDFSRQIVLQNVATLKRLRDHMNKRMPIGPGRELTTRREDSLKIQELDPLAKNAMREDMGPEAWSALMEDLYRSNT